MHDEDFTRWVRVDALFAEVLTRPPDDRLAFVRASCGDDRALEREVLAMLDSLGSAEAAIGESVGALFVPSGPLVDAPDAALPEGTRVGAYVVRRLVGRGGMGNVYAAVRADGSVAREVALKVVRTTVTGGAIGRRIRQEQRILGTLEHPHIARLYDSGVTAEGSPYLVMELVQGTRIDQHLATARAPLSQRLRLFEEVCDAVAFAHQRLVVHRDLKPANVLVAVDGHVRLLDFGIARLLADADGDGAPGAEAATRPGQLVLTPEYAAPEQARGEPASVGMDVYALGVLLHELLTGSRPAWQRLVMTRAENTAIERAMMPPSRNAADPELARGLHGDLDHVILTALAPGVTTRYESVAALREDVRRVREGFPVLVRRSSPAERPVRLVRRNPWLSAAWGVAAVATLEVMANTIVQGRRVARERDLASAERDVAAVERDRANRERDRARATNRLLASLFERGDPFAPGRGDTLRVTQVLAEGVERVNRDLAFQPAARAELLTALGRAFHGLGRFGDAQSLLDTARALQADDPDVTPAERAATLSALGNLTRARGEHATADTLFRSSMSLRTPATDAARAGTVPNDGRMPPLADTDSAGHAARGRAVTLVSLGAGHMERNRFDSARVYLDSAYALLQLLPRPDSGALADYFNNRATLAMRSGDAQGAARFAGQAYAINVARLGADHPRVAVEMANLGFLLDRTGRSGDAEPLLRGAVRLLGERLPAGHPSVRSAKLTLGGILSRTGRLDDAERLIAEVVAAERAAGDEAKRGLPITLDNHAGVLEKLGRTAEAEAVYREAFTLQLAMGGQANPGTAILRAKVADIACRTNSGTPGLLGEFEQSLDVLDRSFPPLHPFRLGGRGQYGACLVRTGRRDEGERELLATFNDARRALPVAHSAARSTGRELLALYAAPVDSARRMLIQAQLDSLTAGSGAQ